MAVLLGLVRRLGVQVKRKYRAETSRTKGVEYDGGDAVVFSANEPPTDRNVSIRTADAIEPESSAAEPDIDAMIESFNFTQATVPQQEVSNDRTFMHEVHTAQTGSAPTQSHPSFGEDTFVDCNELFDPVLGIDGLIPDPPWMFADFGQDP